MINPRLNSSISRRCYLGAFGIHKMTVKPDAQFDPAAPPPIKEDNMAKDISERDQGLVKKGNDLAMEYFNRCVQNCKTEDELAGFVQMACILSTKIIHGIEGQKFKKDFLRSAIADREKIIPQRVQ